MPPGRPLGLRQAIEMTQAARHGDPEIDRARTGANRYGAGDRQRDHAGRLALRPFRTGAAVVATQAACAVDRMISEALPLEQAPLAFRRAQAPGALKVLLHA